GKLVSPGTDSVCCTHAMRNDAQLLGINWPGGTVFCCAATGKKTANEQNSQNSNFDLMVFGSLDPRMHRGSVSLNAMHFIPGNARVSYRGSAILGIPE